MFSKYKKSGTASPKPGAKPAPAAVTPASAEPARQSLMRAKPPSSAEAVPQDKEKRRKERLGEIKLELHKALLDNLNLAALETATEADLRAEINSITQESLEELGIVLNRD